MRLADEFPIGSTLQLEGAMFYVLGYTTDAIVVSMTDPSKDALGALRTKEFLCIDCARSGHATVH